MTYEEALKKLEEAEQTHILQYYNELSEEEQKALLDSIELTDFSVIKSLKNREELSQKGVISPISAMELSEIKEKEETFKAIGLEAVKAGKVGAVLLAGGMGTRLGSDNPKGMYNIGLTKEVYIFQRLIENLMDVVKMTTADGSLEGADWVHLFVMTSDKNHEKTVNFLGEKNYFGYNPEYIHFFRQDMAPATDYSGKVYMEAKGIMANSPNGNGGWYSSMATNGLVDLVKKEGIEFLNVFAVDNVLQRIADPVFVGAVIDGNYEVGAKCVRKAAPDEKVGAMCLEDGKPSIIEYYELTQELMDAKLENGDPAYNFGVILNYLLSVKALDRIVEKEMPLHIVEKKIPYMDAEGNTIKPSAPNGFKFESLILDMIHLMDTCLPYEVVREREFAPIKNPTGVDSVESARALCQQNGIEL